MPLVAERRVQKADGGVEITTLDAVDRSRLTVETLKWYLCKLAPKKYGDKTPRCRPAWRKAPPSALNAPQFTWT